MADEADFDAFVVARSPALLRTAYLLVQDEGLAEDLLQTALTKAWFAWRRIEDAGGVRPPDPGHHLGVVVAPAVDARDADRRPPRAGRSATARRGRGQDLWEAVGHLPPAAARGRRAAVPRGPHRGRDGRADGLLGEHGEEPVREGAGQAAASTPRWRRSPTRGAGHEHRGPEGRSPTGPRASRDARSCGSTRCTAGSVRRDAAASRRPPWARPRGARYVVAGALLSDDEERSGPSAPVVAHPVGADRERRGPRRSGHRAPGHRPGRRQGLGDARHPDQHGRRVRGRYRSLDDGDDAHGDRRRGRHGRVVLSRGPGHWFVMEYAGGGGTVSQCRRTARGVPRPPRRLRPGHAPRRSRSDVRHRDATEARAGLRTGLSRVRRLRPLATTDATFGFAVYSPAGAPRPRGVAGLRGLAMSRRDSVDTRWWPPRDPRARDPARRLRRPPW